MLRGRASAPILADITVAGRPVKAVAQAHKQGFVFVLDRATGKPMWPIEERPETGVRVATMVGCLMGLSYVDGRVRAPNRRGKGRSVRFLIDSGAVYSVLRRTDWQALGLKPARELDFVLADGSTLTRGVSECVFDIEGQRATSPVVLGESEDEALLGAVTLETLGLMLNPLSRRLVPMRLMLAGSRPRR